MSESTSASSVSIASGIHGDARGSGIGRLPPEILSEIMIKVARDWYEKRTLSLPRWIGFLRVSHHWRTVALSTPSLWANISFAHLDQFLTFLSRSRKAPLCIHIDYDPSVRLRVKNQPDLHAAVIAAAREAYRLEQVHLVVPRSYLRLFGNEMTGAPDLLRELIVVCDPDDETLDGLGPGPLLRVPAHRLRHLELFNVLPEWSDPMFHAHLSTLEVNLPWPCTEDNETPCFGTFEEMWTALAFMSPSIEALRLEWCIPAPLPRLPGGKSPPDTCRPLHFPRLCSLLLKGKADGCSVLLARMTFSTDTKVEISDCAGDDNSSFTPLARTLARLYPGTLEVMSIEAVSPSLELCGYSHAKRDPNELQCHLKLLLYATPAASEDHLIDIFVREAPALFAGVHTVDALRTRLGVRHRWERLFQVVPRLTHLALHGGDASSSGSFAALGVVGRSVNGVDSLLLPKLTTLELIRLGVKEGEEPAAASELVKAATLRAENGISLLELVVEDCSFVDVKTLSLLRKAVRTVRLTQYATKPSGLG